MNDLEEFDLRNTRVVVEHTARVDVARIERWVHGTVHAEYAILAPATQAALRRVAQ